MRSWLLSDYARRKLRPKIRILQGEGGGRGGRSDYIGREGGSIGRSTARASGARAPMTTR